MSRKLSWFIMVVGIAWFAGVVNAEAGGWTKTIKASDDSSVTVVLRSADVSVTGWDREELKLESDDSDDKEGIKVKVEGDSIQIGAEKTDGDLSDLVRGVVAGAGSDWAERNLKIQMPKGASLSVTVISGDVKVGQLAGRCRVKTISGEIEVRSCKGPVDIKTVSGDVTVQEVGSSLSVKSVSGDLEAIGVRGSLVEAKSVSGSLKLKKTNVKQARIKSHSGNILYQGAVESQGSLEAKTFSGDVFVALPAGSGFELDSKTRSGNVKVGFSLQQAEKEPNQVKGRVGGGGAEVELKSFSGDIEVQPRK